jgi:Aerotolerance regulator N-terminal/CARDB
MPSWLTNLFIHPEYVLPGLALVSLPLIIHLINRLRFRRVRFAAMEFLLSSQKRNRRRILLEQLLLLLLRMIVVAALVMLVARPLLDPEQFSLFQGKKTHHFVLLDDSGSMRDRWGETSAFDAANEVIRRIAAEGERKPDTQTLTLLLASNPDQPVFTQENLNKEFTARLDTTLKGLKASHRAIDLTAGAQAARRLLGEQKGSARHLHLISDFRGGDWDGDTALAAALRDAEQEKIGVNLIKTVPEAHANLGITDLTGAIDVAAANVPLRLSATVRNYGEQVARDIRLTVLIDGKKLPATEIIESLEPRREVTREFDVVFQTTGAHDVQLTLPADALEQDNHRFLSLDLAEANAVLILDGSPSNSEAFYLADALAPSPGLTGFAPSIESLDYLRRRPIDRFQSIFLLNVAELAPDAVRTLEQYVEAGGGLAWFLGDQVRAAFYNDKLYRDGHGLFPARLAAPAELLVDETNPAPDLGFGDHPVFRVLEGEENPFVDLLKINRYFTVARDWAPPDGVRVIATLRNRAPLMLEHQLGKGRILTCLTALGTTWNNWPLIPPTFVSMQLEAAKYIARSERSLERKLVGEPIVISLDGAAYSPQVEIRPPGGSRIPLSLGIRPSDPSTSANAALRYEDAWRQTDEPGLYTLVTRRQDATEESKRFAYNVPDSESRLNLATTEIVQRRLGPGTHARIQEPGDFSWVQGEPTSRDIDDYVLILLLALLLGEQALALRLSYHPPSAGARA